MRPRKKDFRGDARKGAKNYDTVSSDDSEAYRRKDPFAGRRKRPSGRRAQKIVSCMFDNPTFQKNQCDGWRDKCKVYSILLQQIIFLRELFLSLFSTWCCLKYGDKLF